MVISPPPFPRLFFSPHGIGDPEKHKFSSDIVKGWVDSVLSVRASVPDDNWNSGITEARKKIAPNLPAFQPSTSLAVATQKLSGVIPSQAGPQPAKKVKVEAGGDSSL